MKRKKRGLRPGIKAAIFKLTTFGRPTLEGRATLIARVPWIEDLWLVRFDGEEVARQRFVHPNLQEDPDAALAALTEAWRAAIGREVVSDFRPGLLRTRNPSTEMKGKEASP